MSIESAMPSNHLILCHPLLLLPSIFPSIRVFSNESVLCIRWPKYWSFSFSISPPNECSGLISFRMDWLDLLAVQGTFKSFLQYHSSKASIIRCSVFFVVQLSHSYMTTGKIIALTIRTFVGKVISLLFNMLSRLLVAFFPRSKCLSISWLLSPSAVILKSLSLNNANYITKAGLPGGSVVKNLLMQETQEMEVWSLGQEDPLEKGIMARKIPWRREWQHSSILAWKNPMDRGAWWAFIHGVTKPMGTLGFLRYTVLQHIRKQLF